MVFSFISALTAVALTVVGILLYRGHTSLVHAHHRTHVRDHQGYGKAMGRATLALAAFLLAAGVLSLAMGEKSGGLYALPVVVMGLGVYAVLVLHAQRRYNRQNG